MIFGNPHIQAFFLAYGWRGMLGCHCSGRDAAGLSSTSYSAVSETFNQTTVEEREGTAYKICKGNF